MRGHKVSSEEILMNMQLRQCLPESNLSDWKKPDFVWLFLSSIKSQRRLSQILKFWL